MMLFLNTRAACVAEDLWRLQWRLQLFLVAANAVAAGKKSQCHHFFCCLEMLVCDGVTLDVFFPMDSNDTTNEPLAGLMMMMMEHVNTSGGGGRMAMMIAFLIAAAAASHHVKREYIHDREREN
jgi:hypothetical protein